MFTIQRKEKEIMKKLILLLTGIALVLTVGCGGEKEDAKTSESTSNSSIIAEGPLALPEGSNAEANGHNDEGISHYKEGHYDVALKHFQQASEVDSSLGEIHYNEAISLDKLGKHGEATKHFKVAQEKANDNKSILESKILLSHVK
jgi:Flp pilus assembly protein TadD